MGGIVPPAAKPCEGNLTGRDGRKFWTKKYYPPGGDFFVQTAGKPKPGGGADFRTFGAGKYLRAKVLKAGYDCLPYPTWGYG